MSDGLCAVCGTKLGGMDRLRGETRCGSCRAQGVMPVDTATTCVNVTGLTEVADIATFRHALVQLPGIKSVGVKPSKRVIGDFEYLIQHDPAMDLAPVIADALGERARVEPEPKVGSQARYQVTITA
jgi:hypothetical protein